MANGRRVVTLSILSLVVIAAGAGCAKRSFNSTLKTVPDNATVAGQLDPNDISILFPLPNSPDGIKDMLSLDALNAAGTPLFSADLFGQVMTMTGGLGTNYELTVDHGDGPVKETMRSGIVTAGKRKGRRLFAHSGLSKRLETPPGEAEFHFSDYAKWKVVAVRLDPCAPSQAHNLSPVMGKMTAPPSTFDEVLCQPQLRLIAQPVHSKDYDPEFAAESLGGALADPAKPDYMGSHVKTSDYTIHLVYSLTKDEFKASLVDLKAFKDSCGDVTKNRPLGLHPCLTAQMLGAKFAGNPSADIKAFVTRHANTLTAFAFMGTDLSDNPWVFFGGRMAGGKLQHLPNPAVMIDPKSTTVGRNGKRPRIPFGNGYYQMLTLPAGSGLPLIDRVRQKREAGDTRPLDEIAEEIVAKEMRKNVEKSDQAPVAPVANKSRVVKDVAQYLVPSFLSSTMDSIDKAKAAGEDIKPHVGKIGEFYRDALIVSDPMKVDFFATDCMSCHMVDSALRDMERAVRTQAPDELARLVEASPYKPSPGYPERPSAEGLKTSSYQVVNFGYFHDRPSVGLRTVNETIHALEIIKTSFSAAYTRQNDSCPQKLLDACVVEAQPPFHLRIPAAALVRYGAEVDAKCRAKACPAAPPVKFQDSERPIIGKLAMGAVLKEQPKALDELKDFQKCDVSGKEIGAYFVEKALVNDHYKLWTNFKCSGIDRSQAVYVSKDHITF